MSVRLDRAIHNRSRCAHCKAEIAEATARIVETAHATSYFHLECATRERPELVRKVLLAGEPLDPLVVPDRAALLVRVRARLDELAAERRAAAAEPEDPVLDPLFAQLDADPHDRDVLSVLADVLSVQGDPRGELITAELTAEARPQAPLPARRRDELRAQLAPSFGDVPAAVTWNGGFIRRLEVQPQTAPRTARLAPVWKHPSMRLLLELSVTGAAGPLMYAWFPALRRLELTSHLSSVGPVGEIIATMPRLETLALAGIVDHVDLAHASLAEIHIGASNDHVLHELDPARLPKLARLTAISANQRAIEALLRSGWCTRLDYLGLRDTGLGSTFPSQLEAALDGRRLPTLDLTGARFDCSMRALKKLCDKLIARLEPQVGMAVRHSEKPEWGPGRVVDSSVGKVVIEFELAGRKILRDTLPQLVFDDD